MGRRSSDSVRAYDSDNYATAIPDHTILHNSATSPPMALSRPVTESPFARKGFATVHNQLSLPARV